MAPQTESVSPQVQKLKKALREEKLNQKQAALAAKSGARTADERLKDRVLREKLKLKANPSGSTAALERAKGSLRQAKLKSKLARVRKGKAVALPSQARLREEVSALQGSVRKLTKSVGKPGRPGTPSRTQGRPSRYKSIAVESLKNQIRRERIVSKEGGGEVDAEAINRLKVRIAIEKLWAKLELLDTKWDRWRRGGGDIDPLPHRNMFNEVQDLSRKVGDLRGSIG